MTLLWFRDPHAFAKDQAFGLGLEDQEDQPLYDGIDALTRDQASYLRLLLIGQSGSDVVIRTTKEQFQIYLEAAQQFYVVPENTTLMQ